MVANLFTRCVTGGCIGVALFNPKGDYAVVVLSNVSSDFALLVADHIIQRLEGKPDERVSIISFMLCLMVSGCLEFIGDRSTVGGHPKFPSLLRTKEKIMPLVLIDLRKGKAAAPICALDGVNEKGSLWTIALTPFRRLPFVNRSQFCRPENLTGLGGLVAQFNT